MSAMEEQDKDIRKRSFSIESTLQFLKMKFSLNEDKASEREVIENLKKGVDFQGTNLWVLIFATFIALLGLNINSAAVIIGAMLISPLMGPIMGLGLSVGINDFELMKRSFRNFMLMVLVCIATSTLYFLVSPLSGAQSELLARTTPTTYDVLIAFFGGLAGIVAQSRKDRAISTVIPGVAIATTLLPPLCTAGFGIATLNFKYFAGAFYLFFINTIFIAIATYIVVRFLNYPKKVFLDKKRETTVKRYMVIISVVTLIPSVFIAYNLIQRSIFETAADRYIGNVFQFSKTRIIDKKREYRPDGQKENYIELILLGEPLSEDAIEGARMQMTNYGLTDTRLIVHQSGEGESKQINVASLQSGYHELLWEKNRRIGELEDQVRSFSGIEPIPAREIAKEINALNAEDINDIILSRAVSYDQAGNATDTVVIAIMKLNQGKAINSADREKIASWLKVRTKTDNVRFYIE